MEGLGSQGQSAVQFSKALLTTYAGNEYPITSEDLVAWGVDILYHVLIKASNLVCVWLRSIEDINLRFHGRKRIPDVEPMT